MFAGCCKGSRLQRILCARYPHTDEAESRCGHGACSDTGGGNENVCFWAGSSDGRDRERGGIRQTPQESNGQRESGRITFSAAGLLVDKVEIINADLKSALEAAERRVINITPRQASAVAGSVTTVDPPFRGLYYNGPGRDGDPFDAD